MTSNYELSKTTISATIRTHLAREALRGQDRQGIRGRTLFRLNTSLATDIMLKLTIGYGHQRYGV